MAKTKALISFAVTAKLICVFVFAYAKSRFSHDAAHLYPNCSSQFYLQHDISLHRSPGRTNLILVKKENSVLVYSWRVMNGSV